MTSSATEKSTGAAVPAGRTAGFTLLEILIAIAIVAILTAIAYPFYSRYIDQATVTRAIHTMDSARIAIEDYNINNGVYPQSIDFDTGQDTQGKMVLPQALVDDFKTTIFAVESYAAAAAADYTLKAKARDTRHTLLVLTPGKVVTQGP